jgi:hypothetical protein
MAALGRLERRLREHGIASLTQDELQRLQAERQRQHRIRQIEWHKQHGLLQPDRSARERFLRERRQAVIALARVGAPVGARAWRIKAQVHLLDRLARHRLLSAPVARPREHRPHRQRVASGPRRARAPDEPHPEPVAAPEARLVSGRRRMDRRWSA